MPSFKIVAAADEIKLKDGWIPATKFRERLVDEQGRAVRPEYQGHQYKIIGKGERTFSSLERFERGLLGTLAVVCTLSLALFSKSVRNLFIKSKETIRFGVFVPPGSAERVYATLNPAAPSRAASPSAAPAPALPEEALLPMEPLPKSTAGRDKPAPPTPDGAPAPSPSAAPPAAEQVRQDAEAAPAPPRKDRLPRNSASS